MIGGAGKKIQTMVELAEELYERVNDLRARLEAVDETVQSTADRVESIEREVDEQRAILEAMAEAQGIDVESVVESASEEEAAEGGSETSAGQATTE